MKTYEMKTKKVFFHEEAHIYFSSEEDYNKFSASYAKNPQWALKMKSKWNPVMSITQILSGAFPFSGGDLKITKAWYEKEMRYKKVDEETIQSTISYLEEVEKILKESVERSQDEGNEGHDNIQTFIEHYILEGKTDAVKSSNVYWKAFTKQLMDKEQTLGAFVKNIETVLPSEIPIVGELKDGVLYAGKWDLLVKMKDGRTILIDIKTGSNVIEEKRKKVFLQLNGYAELVRQSLEIEVDELLCWEVSYKIPYKEALSKYKAEKRKIDKGIKEGKELPVDKLLDLEAEVKKWENDKGYREYYFMEHSFTKSDSFKELAIGEIEKQKRISFVTEEVKGKKWFKEQLEEKE